MSTIDAGAANDTAQRFGHHDNAFGALRLLFATLVIVAHTPEIIDGNRYREPLTWLTGTMSLGDLSVDAFLIVSGYLITASVLASTASSYLRKRISRIYPGYLCAFLVCVLVVAPLGGGGLPTRLADYMSLLVQALLIQPPKIGHVFAGTPFPALDAPVWTVSVEFRCYLIALLLSVLGALRRRRTVVALTAIVVAAVVAYPGQTGPYDPSVFSERIPDLASPSDWADLLIGSKSRFFRLTSVFLVGSTFFLYREKLRFTPLSVAVAAVLFTLCLLHARSAHLGAAIFGGYVILAVAHLTAGSWFARINNENDVSYGVYLYAWPSTKLILWWWPGVPMLLVGCLTVVAAFALGWASWTLVERPVLAWTKSVFRRRAADPILRTGTIASRGRPSARL